MENWTFLGATDDKVFQYPHNYELLNYDRPSALNILTDYAVFGPPVIIHQSALFQQPELISDILKRDESIIFNMIRHDRLRILSRNKDFSGWPAQAKKVGVNTYQETPFSEGELLNGIRDFQGLLDDQDKGLVGMPRTDCSAVMHDLLMSAIQCSSNNRELGLSLIPDNVPVLETIASNYMARYKADLDNIGGTHSPPTRTHWEQAVIDTVDKGDGNKTRENWKCQLMSLANECHHLAHGLSIASEVDFPIALNTGLSNRFIGCYDHPVHHSEAEEEAVEEYTPEYFDYERAAVMRNFRKFSDALYDTRTELGSSRNLFKMKESTVETQTLKVSPYEQVMARAINDFLELPEPEIWRTSERVRDCDAYIGIVATAAISGLAAGVASIWKHKQIRKGSQLLISEDRTEEIGNVNRRKFLQGIGYTVLSASAGAGTGGYIYSNFSAATCDNKYFGETDLVTDYSAKPFVNWPSVFESTFTLKRSVADLITKPCFRYNIPDDSLEITNAADLPKQTLQSI